MCPIHDGLDVYVNNRHEFYEFVEKLREEEKEFLNCAQCDVNMYCVYMGFDLSVAEKNSVQQQCADDGMTFAIHLPNGHVYLLGTIE